MAIVNNPIIVAGGGGTILISGVASSTATIQKDGTLLGTVVLDGQGEGFFDVEEDGTYEVSGNNLVKNIQVFVRPLAFLKALNELSWQEISELSQSGNASNIFKIGDRKKIHLQGTVGTLAINQDFWVYIIGFDHNGSKGIDFGTFKSAETGGNDWCLVDSNYNSSSTNGTKYFNMNHSQNTNVNGWQGCDMRYDILGSCKAKNQQNAPVDTATTPVANTLMSCLPLDLRKVMKPMTIWTDNKGGGNDTASNVTTTIDYLPLLAEVEIFGARRYANSTEQQHQRQYEYYTLGNSKVKNRHDNSSSASWWERSPCFGESNGFCRVYSGGLARHYDANGSFGLCPAFRV